MSKLVYPNEGIYNYCKNDIEECSRNLSKAISNGIPEIPEDFCYKSYLNNLGSVINDFYKQINSIDSKLLKTNDNYELLESDLSVKTNRIELAKIKERDRMII